MLHKTRHNILLKNGNSPKNAVIIDSTLANFSYAPLCVTLYQKLNGLRCICAFACVTRMHDREGTDNVNHCLFLFVRGITIQIIGTQPVATRSHNWRSGPGDGEVEAELDSC